MGKIKKQILPSDVKKEIKFSEEKKKFRLGIDSKNNPIITIDDTTHFMHRNTFDSFLKGCITIAQKMNPEIDYSDYIE